MKYFSTILKLFFLLLIIVIALGTWSVYTQAGRNMLTHFLNNIPFSNNVAVEVRKINSIFPLHTELSYVEIYEEDATWVKIEDIEIKADILEYLKQNEVPIDVSIGQLFLNNLQTEDTSTDASDEQSLNTDLGFKITLDLKVNSISLAGYTDNKPILINNLAVEARYTGKFLLNASARVSNFGAPLLLAVQASGEVDNIKTDFHLQSDHLQYQEYSVDHLEVSGHLNNLPTRPKGILTFKGNPMEAGNLKGEIEVEHIGKDIHIDLRKLDSEYLKTKGTMILDPSTNDIHLMLQGHLKHHTQPNLFSIEGGNFKIVFDKKGDTFFGSATVDVNSFDGFDSRINELSLDAEIRDFSLNGTGHINLKANGLEGFGTQLNTLSLDAKLSQGTASFNLDADGPDTKAQLAGTMNQKDSNHILSFQAIKILHDKVRLALTNPTEITIHGDTVTIPQTRFDLDQGSLSASGTAGSSLMDLKLNIDLPLEPLATLFLPPEHFLKGHLTSDISIKGAPESPNILGQMTLTEGLYENIEYGVYIHDMQSQVNATGKQIKINSFHAKSHNEGNIQIIGSIDLEDETANVRASGDSFKLLDSELVETTLKDFTLKLAGKLNTLTCSGNVRFEKGKLDIGITPTQEIQTLKECEDSKGSSQIAEPSEPLPFSVSLDIGIESQPRFKVYGRGLDSLWGGNLKVKGNSSEPLISGEIKLKRGSFKLLGTILELSEGSVVFSGGPENIPYLKIVATTQNADYKMQIVIRGTPERLIFDFSSTPSLPRDEIISQILFGKLTEDLTAFEAVQLARSIAALTGGGSSTDVMGELSEALGVDLISVDVDQEQSSASIHIEKRLNDRVKIVTDQSSDIEESTIGVEVKVMENVTVKTEHGLIVPNESVSVNYKINY